MKQAQKQSRMSAELRARIIAAARERIAREGLVKFSLTEVAKAAGVSRATLYRTIGSRDDLLGVIVADDLRYLSYVLEIAWPRQCAKPEQAMPEEARQTRVAQAGPYRERRPIALPAGVEAASSPSLAPSNVTALPRPLAQPLCEPPPQSAQPRAPDAWLERRLRVFERALGNLETRQAEGDAAHAHAIAAMQETIHAIAERIEAGETRQAANHADLCMAVREAGYRLHALEHPLPRQPAETPGPQSEPQFVAAEDSALEAPEPEAPPALQSESESAPDDAPMTYLDTARRSARLAAELAQVAQEGNPAPRRLPWMVAAGAAALLLLASLGVALGSFAHGAPLPTAGVSHLRALVSPQARLAALADHGDAKAQVILALGYMRGPGRNEKLAARWAIPAATKGDPAAEYLLATLYQRGAGVPEDKAQALRLFEASAEHGNRKAMHDLAIAYSLGSGTAKNPAEAARWFARAAALGYVDSQFNLAVLYERGDGVPQSLADAYKWYAIAAASGDAESKSRADVLRTQLPPALVSAAQSAADAFRPASG